ncbi:MAG: protein containing transglutaminase-like domain, putative cysteine protease [Hyphomicrobiales bacterium]|nr:protein containing transglutaminase-like domain, putative cysteine protease [Hyphomicrobiales bacterium]
MKISIRHQLSFAVGHGNAHAVQHILLTPLDGPTQKVLRWSIELDGMDRAARIFDAFGNSAQLVSQIRPQGDLVVTVEGIVETVDRHGVVGRLPRDPMPALFRRTTPLTQSDLAIHEPLRDGARKGGNRIELLHRLMGRIGEAYGIGADDEEAHEPAAQTQAQSQSSGGEQSQEQDAGVKPEADATTVTHAFIGACRALEIPARFITGYLAESEDGPAAFHAWAEAYDDGLGWIGFDSMLGICPTDRHVRVASGLDALSCTPVRTVPDLGTPQAHGLSVEAVAQ